jgi:hypothetical protein
MKNDKSILGYKQAPGCKVWQVLPTLSLERVEQATQPEANGLKDGSGNIPAAGSIEIAETEARILYQAEEYLASVNDMATKEMTDIGRRIGECAVQREEAFADLEAAADNEFQRYLLQAKPELKKLRVEERRQLRDLKLFKARNRLERLASYPESRWLHGALVALVICVECLANTYFFAAGSELGLLGGFFQALLISIGNVLASLLAGRYALTNLNHVNRLRVAAGAASFCVWIVGVSAYHLLVAHYRDMLAITPEGAILSAVNRFWSSPFHLESLDSVLVLVIGVVISIIALIDGYTFDDSYPGYGKIDRKYQEKRRIYEAKEAEVRSRMAGSIEAAEKRLDARLKAYEEKDAKITDLLSGAASVVDHFDNIYSQVDDIVPAAVSKYRAANRKIRTAGEPPSFATMPKVKRLLQVDIFRRKLEEFREVKVVSAGLLQNIREHGAKVRATLTDRTGAMMERIERLAEDVGSKAEQEVKFMDQEV